MTITTTILLALLFVSLLLLAITGKKLLQAISEKNQLAIENTQLKESSLLQSKAKDSLESQFKLLSQEALENSQSKFFELAKSFFERESAQNTKDSKHREESITKLLNPLEEQLKVYQKALHEMEKHQESKYTNIDKELKNVAQTAVQLSQETSNLKTALKRPHIRGRWGEVQLKNCVEMSGMSEYCDFSLQDYKSSDEKRLIPDMTVKMPGGHIVIVDAKTPIDAFLDYIEAKDEETKSAQLQRHSKHLKEHIKQLSSKQYHSHFEESADFTVMFLPNESFLYAALEVEPEIINFALDRKVLITTPPTFVGLLKVILHGWNEEKLTKNAQLISEVGTELHKRICDFTDAYSNVGKFLDKAKLEFDVSNTRLESRVIKQALKLEKLGAKSHKELPQEVKELT